MKCGYCDKKATRRYQGFGIDVYVCGTHYANLKRIEKLKEKAKE